MPPWADLYRYEPEAAEPRPVLWRFQDAGYRTFYARFRTTRSTPEVNSRRYVLSGDGKTIVAGCNGCTLIDARTGQIEIRLEPKD